MDLDDAAALARTLVREAGDLAVADRRRAQVTAKGDGGDLVTSVDLAAERRIVAALRDRFPDHGILGEEGGDQGADGARLRWLIDPLDGTNNYVLGIACYGVCLTLCEEDRPLLAVVHDSPGRRTYSAIRGRGAVVHEGEEPPRRLRIADADALARTTVSWTQGYGVGQEDALRDRIFDRLDHATKRVLRTWAPSCDWGLLASGTVGAVIAYRNEIWDLVGGVLIAEEAGAVSRASPDGTLVLTGIPGTVEEITGLLDA